MGGSGLIVVVIVAAWALFLVPQWLHRRAAAAQHLADRIPEPQDGEAQQAAEATPDGKDVQRPGEPARRRRVHGRRQLVRGPSSTQQGRRWPRLAGWASRLRARRPGEKGSPAPLSAAADAPAPRSAAVDSPAPRSAAARRRRVLSVLALATLVAAAAVGVAAVTPVPVPAWIVAVPGGLMVSYLVLLAVVRPGAHHGQPPVRVVPIDATHADGRRDEGITAAQALPEQVGHVAPRPPAPAPLAPASDAVQDEDGSTWTPVPVPTPTYVTAPRARRSVRTIDLSNPGSWTASSGLAPSAAARVSEGATDSDDEQASGSPAWADHRRAVGD